MLLMEKSTAWRERFRLHLLDADKGRIEQFSRESWIPAFAGKSNGLSPQHESPELGERKKRMIGGCFDGSRVNGKGFRSGARALVVMMVARSERRRLTR